MNKLLTNSIVLSLALASTNTLAASCPAKQFKNKVTDSSPQTISIPVNSPNGFNITAIVQNALNNASTEDSNGGVVRIPEGEFTLGTIDIPSNTRLEVHGKTTLILAPGSQSMFKMGLQGLADPIKNVEIRSYGSGGRFDIDYDKVGNFQEKLNAFALGHVNNFSIKNVNVLDNFSFISAISVGSNASTQNPDFERKAKAGLIQNITGFNQHYGYGTVQLQSGYNIKFKNVSGVGGATVRLESGFSLLNLEPRREGNMDCITAINTSVKEGHAALLLGPHGKYNGRIIIDTATATDSLSVIKTDAGFKGQGNKPDAAQNGIFDSVMVTGNITAERSSKTAKKAQLKGKDFPFYPKNIVNNNSFDSLTTATTQHGQLVQAITKKNKSIPIKNFAPLSVVLIGSVHDEDENNGTSPISAVDGQYRVNIENASLITNNHFANSKESREVIYEEDKN